MKTQTTLAIAIASLLSLGGSAMAASYHHSARAYRSYAPQQETYGARGQIPFDAFASAPNMLSGRSDVTASQPSFNPALDRAKGSL